MVTREFFAQATAQQIAEEWIQRKVQGKRVIRSAEAIYNKPTLEQAQKIKQANAIYSQLISKPETQQAITRATERKESQRVLKEEAQRRGFDDPREFAVRRKKLQEDVAQRKREERDNRRVQAGDTTKEQIDQQQEVRRVGIAGSLSTATVQNIQETKGVQVGVKGGVGTPLKTRFLEVDPLLVQGAQKFTEFQEGLSTPLSKEQRDVIAKNLVQAITPQYSPPVKEGDVLITKGGLQSVGQSQQVTAQLQALPTSEKVIFKPQFYKNKGLLEVGLSEIALREPQKQFLGGVIGTGQKLVDIGADTLKNRDVIARNLMQVITPQYSLPVQKGTEALTPSGIKSIGQEQQIRDILQLPPVKEDVMFKAPFYKTKGLLEVGLSEVALRGIATSSIVAGASTRYLGEKPITTGLLVGAGFGSKVISSALISQGGVTAIATKGTLAVAGGAGLGVELGTTFLIGDEQKRAVRLGESITKIGAISLGAGLGGRLTDPRISKADQRAFKELAKRMEQGSDKQILRVSQGDKRFTNIITEKGPNIRLTQKITGELVRLPKYKTVLGKRVQVGSIEYVRGTSTVQYLKKGVLVSTQKTPFLTQVQSIKSPTISTIKVQGILSGAKVDATIRTPISYDRAIGRTFTGGKGGAKVRAGVVFKDFSFKQFSPATKTSDLARLKLGGSGKVINLDSATKFRFLLPDKAGRLTAFQSNLPQSEPALDSVFASKVSTVSPSIPLFKGITPKTFTVFGTVPSFSNKVTTKQAGGLKRDLARGLQQRSLLTTSFATSSASRSIVKQDSAVSTRQTTRQITEIIQQPVFSVPTTPPIIPKSPPTGIFLPPLDFEVPRRKKKKKKRKPSKQAKVLAQDLTAKVLNLKPVKVSRKKARKLKSKPLGIRRGAVIR